MPKSSAPRPLSGLLNAVGELVVGLAVNSISDAYPGAAAPAVAAAPLFILGVAVGLRRFPPDALLQQLTARACLGGAAVAVVVSLLGPSAARGWAVLVAATLGIASCSTLATSG